MLGSQQFCVRWNSYQTNLQDVFPKLLTNEHFVDVTLACEAQMIKCHKVVLSACSTYFEQLLVHNPCQHPIIFMKDMRHWEVQALVDFMYKGEVNVSQDELASLLKAAEALQIRGLCGADRQLDGKAVSLPPETILSDSGGRETPPAKKRRQNETKENSAPTTSSVATPNNDVLATSAPQKPFGDTDQTNISRDDEEQGSFKKENLDLEDSYYDNDGDEPLDLQDDSNSLNQEISMPTSPLDQAGPSGLSGNQLDKAATAWGQAASLHYMMGVTARRGRPKRDDPSLKAAARLVLERKYTLRQAALQFQIPPTTLRNYLKRSGMLRMPLKRGRPVLQLSGYYYSDSVMNPPNWKYNNAYLQSQQQPQPSQPHQQQPHPGPPQQSPLVQQQQQLPPQHLQQHQPHQQLQVHQQSQPLVSNMPMQPPNVPYYPENSSVYNNMYPECKGDMYDIQQLLASKPESMPLEIDLDSSEAETDHHERRANIAGVRVADAGSAEGQLCVEGGDMDKSDYAGGDGAMVTEGSADGACDRGKEGGQGEGCAENDSEDSESEQSDVDDSNDSETDVNAMQSEAYSNNLF